MTAWAVSALRGLTQGRLVWAVQERCAPVIASPGLADEVVLADTSEWKRQRWSPATWRAQLATFASLRRYGFETGLDFQGHSKTAICLRISGAKRRLASRATDALAARLNEVVDCGVGSVHETEVARRLVEEAYESCTLPAMPIMPETSKWDGKFVSLQTGAGHPDKQVSQEHWEKVARILVDKGVRTVVVGGPSDPKLMVNGVEDKVGKLSLLDTVGLVAGSAVHVASDTGTGHIAAAYGVPTVSVFGPTDPVLYAPKGPKSRVLRKSEDVHSVGAAEIAEAVLQFWEEA